MNRESVSILVKEFSRKDFESHSMGFPLIAKVSDKPFKRVSKREVSVPLIAESASLQPAAFFI
jgi:hypothetical protein